METGKCTALFLEEPICGKLTKSNHNLGFYLIWSLCSHGLSLHLLLVIPVRMIFHFCCIIDTHHFWQDWKLRNRFTIEYKGLI